MNTLYKFIKITTRQICSSYATPKQYITGKNTTRFFIIK